MSQTELNNRSDRELISGTKSDIFFFTSSKKGLGHVSRAVAIANQLNPNLFNVSIGSYDTANDYIKAMSDDNVRIESVSYDFSPSSLPENIHDPSLFEKFVFDNQSRLESLTDSSIIITDFVASSIYLRKYLLQNNLLNAQIIGVYHSFGGITSVEKDATKWQEDVKIIINSLDICFLAEAKPTHDLPYISDEGTLIIPVDPIVHPRRMTDSEIKSHIGLNESDDFILIQAGMQGNDALKDFILSIPDDSSEFFVLLGWDLDESTKHAIQNNPKVKIVEKFVYGNELVGAAKGVIAKPGMQTLSEAVAYNVPILLLPDAHPERKLKIKMLQEIINDNTIPVILNDESPFSILITEWIRSFGKQKKAFDKISGDGSQQVAQYLQSFHLEKYLSNFTDTAKPTPILTTPPGKSAEQLSATESAIKISEIRADIDKLIIQPLKDLAIPHTLTLFGGVAKEMLRPKSDVDILLIVEPIDLHKLAETWGIKLTDPLTDQRIQSLIIGKFDALRLKAQLKTGMELNISLMIPSSYKKIFQSNVEYFNEELGTNISGSPYYTSDFRGNFATIPKVRTFNREGVEVLERRSPGIIRRGEDVTLFGVKHRMLLTAENMNDDLGLGDPTRKIVRGMARAVLYWNDLYIKDGKSVIGIKPEAFNADYFYRLLRDPLQMVGVKMQRKIKNLYFNELRRLQVLYLQKNKKY